MSFMMKSAQEHAEALKKEEARKAREAEEQSARFAERFRVIRDMVREEVKAFRGALACDGGSFRTAEYTSNPVGAALIAEIVWGHEDHEDRHVAVIVVRLMEGRPSLCLEGVVFDKGFKEPQHLRTSSTYEVAMKCRDGVGHLYAFNTAIDPSDQQILAFFSDIGQALAAWLP